MAKFAADDFEAIARGLREREAAKSPQQVPMDEFADISAQNQNPGCMTCWDGGWIVDLSNPPGSFCTCPNCGNPQGKPNPAMLPSMPAFVPAQPACVWCYDVGSLKYTGPTGGEYWADCPYCNNPHSWPCPVTDPKQYGAIDIHGQYSSVTHTSPGFTATIGGVTGRTGTVTVGKTSVGTYSSGGGGKGGGGPHPAQAACINCSNVDAATGWCTVEGSYVKQDYVCSSHEYKA